MERTANTVVEVFMERRSEHLPRLRRIAEVIAECTGADLSHPTPSVLGDACSTSNSLDSSHAAVRFSLQSGEVSVEITQGAASSGAQLSSASAASSAVS